MWQNGSLVQQLQIWSRKTFFLHTNCGNVGSWVERENKIVSDIQFVALSFITVTVAACYKCRSLHINTESMEIKWKEDWKHFSNTRVSWKVGFDKRENGEILKVVFKWNVGLCVYHYSGTKVINRLARENASGSSSSFFPTCSNMELSSFFLQRTCKGASSQPGKMDVCQAVFLFSSNTSSFQKQCVRGGGGGELQANRLCAAQM